ncbi:GNAT family N-acetyltransferase [Streptomyces sp. TLI_171]|uniref:GNAT family N-acetyltransferase n=1 Tax=Streptomyces sp. TLI_171 TaxID=1938859 RepID=UPI000C1917FA|nr:GNAT family N-acetyltransferase [Streptomyces sp. TLI_171]RKE23267.1 GNAT acetyltransferase-like protein [Streptomyces sp. TLI_171]
MTNDLLLQRAQELWAALAGVPVSFPRPGAATVAVSPDAGTCPRGWVGVLTLGGAVLATAPDQRRAELVRAAMLVCPDAARLPELLSVGRVLGPAALAYLAPDGLRPARPDLKVRDLARDHPAVQALTARVAAAERKEADLDEITSPAFVVARGGRVLAACGYRHWPCATAQFSVLTAPDHRGLGLAGAAATAAARHALAAGLLPQWRARPTASRRVAARIGFRELGAQLSLEVPRPAAHG